MRLKYMLAAAVLLLCGCSAAVEPSELAYVVAIGIDKSSEENSYEITLQIANPSSISGGSSEEGGKGGEDTISEITVRAPSIFSAVNVANNLNSKQITLAHTALIAFGEEIARDGVESFIDTIRRSEQLRPNTNLCVVLGSAKEYLSEIKPTNEVNPVMYYKMIYDADYTGYIPKTFTKSFYVNSICSCGDMALPISAVKKEDTQEDIIYEGFEYLADRYLAGRVDAQSEEKTQSYGMAVFADGRMIGVGNAIDTEMYNILIGRYEQNEVTYKDEKNPDMPITVVQGQSKKPKIKIKVEEDKPIIYISVDIEADLRSVSENYYIEEDVENFNKNAADSIKQTMDAFLYKTAREYKSDILNLSRYAKRQFKTYEEFEAYNWQDKYENAEFVTQVKFHTRRSGMISRSER